MCGVIVIIHILRNGITEAKCMLNFVVGFVCGAGD
jgi:hypothetical protein